MKYTPFEEPNASYVLYYVLGAMDSQRRLKHLSTVDQFYVKQTARRYQKPPRGYTAD